ncbi:MAG: 16S rRNA (cytosine(967)-C(5))-methyltransferase RsmB, partial [Acidimicrobiia bacterium]|nr:16S rRNA (cytosine(967)-C(5))-methyltransferase RsmB [Acidimicrobiia bacterium]
MISSRAVAVEALVRIEEGAYSHVVVPTILRQKNIPVRNRAQVTSLVYATLRNQRRLDDLISRVSQRKVNRLDPPVRAALRIGAQQLISDVAPYAAVDETVSAVPQRSRGFVNAVLRSLTRLGPPWPEPESLAVALSYPDWIVDLFVTELGESDARGVLVAGNLPGVLTLRPQFGRATAQELTDELLAEGIKVERGELVPEALLVTGTGDPGTLPAVASGRATPQDQASQAVVAYLNPQPGDRVLDVAAAPGGKTTAIAGAVGPKGFVFALDTNSGRLRLVREAALRL